MGAWTTAGACAAAGPAPPWGACAAAGAFGAMVTSSSPSVEISDTVTSGASASLSTREAFFSA